MEKFSVAVLNEDKSPSKRENPKRKAAKAAESGQEEYRMFSLGVVISYRGKKDTRPKIVSKKMGHNENLEILSHRVRLNEEITRTREVRELDRKMELGELWGKKLYQRFFYKTKLYDIERELLKQNLNRHQSPGHSSDRLNHDVRAAFKKIGLEPPLHFGKSDLQSVSQINPPAIERPDFALNFQILTPAERSTDAPRSKTNSKTLLTKGIRLRNLSHSKNSSSKSIKLVPERPGPPFHAQPAAAPLHSSSPDLQFAKSKRTQSLTEAPADPNLITISPADPPARARKWPSKRRQQPQHSSTDKLLSKQIVETSLRDFRRDSKLLSRGLLTSKQEDEDVEFFRQTNSKIDGILGRTASNGQTTLGHRTVKSQGGESWWAVRLKQHGHTSTGDTFQFSEIAESVIKMGRPLENKKAHLSILKRFLGKKPSK